MTAGDVLLLRSGSSSTTAFVVVLTVVSLSWQALKRQKQDKCDSFPTVSASEFISHLTGPDAPYWLLSVCRKLNTSIFEIKASLPMPGPRAFVVADHRVGRKILENPKTIKWAKAFEFFVNVTNGGDNLIAEAENGHRWKHVRKSTMQAFSSSNVKLMIEKINELVDKWIQEKLEQSIESETPIDILKEMELITSDVITQVAFDYTLTEEEREEITRNLAICYTEFAQKAGKNILRQIPITRWMFSGIREAQRCSKALYEMCQKMLQAYRDKNEKKPHALIHFIDSDEEYNDDGERIRDLIAYIIAGFDTTANTLAFAFLELARNPAEQTKLRNALRNCPSSEEERNCKALKHVVRETLRMHPAAATGSVRITKDAVAHSTNVIPVNSIVIVPYYAVGRNVDVFEDPDRFRPSRWENPSDEQMKSYMPFAAGSRNCQGQALAYAELNSIVSKVIRNYEIGVVEEGKAETLVVHKPVGTLLSAKKVPAFR